MSQNNKVRRSPSGKVIGNLGYAVIDAALQAFTDGVQFQVVWSSIQANTEICTLVGGNVVLNSKGTYMFFLLGGSDLPASTINIAMVANPATTPVSLGGLETPSSIESLATAGVLSDDGAVIVTGVTITGVSANFSGRLIIVQIA